MLGRSFYLQNSLTLAESLLGKLLVHRTKEGVTSGMIVEAEAYMGPEDKGAHSYGGRRSRRTEAMFGEGGHAYIYLIYGMYYCFNVVAEKAEKPEAVLIRALEPVEGIELMRRRQAVGKKREPAGGAAKTNWKDGPEGVASLCRGPGKLCMAMGITKENYGQDLCGDTEDAQDRLYIQDYRTIARSQIYISPRINIDYAEEYRDMPWRFYIADNLSVSKVPGKYKGTPLYHLP